METANIIVCFHIENMVKMEKSNWKSINSSYEIIKILTIYWYLANLSSDFPKNVIIITTIIDRWKNFCCFYNNNNISVVCVFISLLYFSFDLCWFQSLPFISFLQQGDFMRFFCDLWQWLKIYNLFYIFKLLMFN